jgi:hypothetical protein
MFSFEEYDPSKAPTNEERAVKIRNLGLEVGKYVESKYQPLEMMFLLLLHIDGQVAPEAAWIHALMAEYKSRAAQAVTVATIGELNAIPLAYAETLDPLFPGRTVLDAVVVA